MLVPPDYDNDWREQQFAATEPWLKYIAFLEAVEIEPQGEPKCHLRWLKDRTELPENREKEDDEEDDEEVDEEEDEENRPDQWVTKVNDRGNALSKDVPLLWVQGPVYVKANTHFIHEEGAFIDCVNCTKCLL